MQQRTYDILCRNTIYTYYNYYSRYTFNNNNNNNDNRITSHITLTTLRLYIYIILSEIQRSHNGQSARGHGNTFLLKPKNILYFF